MLVCVPYSLYKTADSIMVHMPIINRVRKWSVFIINIDTQNIEKPVTNTMKTFCFIFIYCSIIKFICIM